jgi:hypothetical protein
MPNRVIIYTTAYTAGAVLMGYEIFGSRVLRPYFGSSTHVWGALITVFMAGLSAGYAFGGKAADRSADPRKIVLSLLIPPGVLLLAFPVYGYRICALADRINCDERIETLTASVFLFLLPSAFIGALTPVLVKFNTDSIENVGRGNGKIFAVSTVGSITGTVISAFFLVGNTSSGVTISAMGALLLLNAFFALFLGKPAEEPTVNR